MHKIEDSIITLHKLVWQPSFFSHPTWLKAVGVNVNSYKPGKCIDFDNAINKEIYKIRNFPTENTKLPSSLDNRQKIQISFFPYPCRIATALGLVYLECANLLRIKAYRKSLSEYLPEINCLQLLALGMPNKSTKYYSDKDLPKIAFDIGNSILHEIADNHLIWQAILIKLPYPEIAISMPNANSWLNRLERFLIYE